MRRKDREINQMDEMIEIIKKCDVCRVALFDEEYPYIIPLNFGYSYENNVLIFYFHGANAGKKLELLSKNPKASFEMDCSHKLISGDMACDYTMEYESICGNGILEIVSEEEKETALIYLMKQYSNAPSFEFNPANMKAIAVIKLTVSNITGKRLKKS